MVLVGSNDRDNRILHLIAGVDQVVPPHVALYGAFPQRVRIELVVVGKSDKPVDIGVLRRSSRRWLPRSMNREATAVRNRLGVRRQPNQASMIAVVVDPEFDRHHSAPCQPAPKLANLCFFRMSGIGLTVSKVTWRTIE